MTAIAAIVGFATLLTAERVVVRLGRAWRVHRERCRADRFEERAFAFGYGVRSEERK